MLINVSGLLQEPIGARREYGFIGETVDAAAVNSQVELMRTDAGVLVSATCEAEVQQTCSLCLVTYPQSLNFTFSEEYFPLIDVTTGHKLPAPDDAEDLQINEQHHLDVADAVRQYLIMYEPQNPICRTDCRGLCPQCGADRNRVSCKCPPVPARIEWAKLQELWAEQSDG